MMTIEYILAFLAGAIAAVLMIAARIGMKKMGMPLQMDVLSMLGKMVGKGRTIGMIMHIIMGAIFAIPYAFGFYYFGIVENLWLWGTVGGFVHWVVSGALLGMMPGVSAYAKNFGKPDMMGFLMGHLLFGLFVGSCYSIFIAIL